MSVPAWLESLGKPWYAQGDPVGKEDVPSQHDRLPLAPGWYVLNPELLVTLHWALLPEAEILKIPRVEEGL